MKVFALPSVTKALLFDMDSTLYTHEEYAQSQIDLPVKRLAQKQGKTYEQMSAEITEYRKDWEAAHNGESISLGNTFKAFGVSIEENIRWREELCCPEDYLTEDKKLHSVIAFLASRFSIAVVTNNPVSVAIRTLSVLGIRDLFKNIIGLDTCGLSKPDKEIFLKAAQLCTTIPQHCISVGDRYSIDISLPLELGMGGILVDGVYDVYKLPELFTF